MLKLHFLLRNPTKKGRTAIYATVRYHGKVLILFPGKSIDTAHWTNKNGTNKPKPIPENKALISDLKDYEDRVSEIYDELDKEYESVVPTQVLKKAVYGKKIFKSTKTERIEKKETPMSIIEFFRVLMEDSRTGDRRGPRREKLNPNSIKPYQSALNHFTNFQESKRKEYFLKDVDQKLINGFTTYLEVTKNLAFNACAKYLTVFKLLISYAYEKGFIDGSKLHTLKFNITRAKSDNIYLNEKEIEAIANLENLPTKLYDTVRDLLVISCWTGLRFSDFSRLRLQNIHDGFISITQQKVSAKVVIPVHKMVRQILEKYPDGLPKCPPNQVFNRYLKDIGKLVPALDVEFEKKVARSSNNEPEVFKKYDLIMSHSGRRSFCTNMYLKGIAVPTIMAISGHKTQEVFLKYIKADNLVHAGKVKDIFDADEKRENEEEKKRANDEDGCASSCMESIPTPTKPL